MLYILLMYISYSHWILLYCYMPNITIYTHNDNYWSHTLTQTVYTLYTIVVNVNLNAIHCNLEFKTSIKLIMPVRLQILSKYDDTKLEALTTTDTVAVVVVYPPAWPLLVGGVRSSLLLFTSQLLRPSGRQCSHSSGVCPEIHGWQCGMYVGAVAEMVCVVYVSVTKGT